jgi:hypothetical protein
MDNLVDSAAAQPAAWGDTIVDCHRAGIGGGAYGVAYIKISPSIKPIGTYVAIYFFDYNY